MIDLFPQNRLDPAVFQPAVRQATKDLNALLAAATRTRSPAIESTHLLIVLAEIPKGLTQAGLSARDLTTDQWRSGLEGCADTAATPIPLLKLSREVFAPSAIAALEEAVRLAAESGTATLPEALLLEGALHHATPTVQALFTDAGIDRTQWLRSLEASRKPPAPLDIFDGPSPQAGIRNASFSPSGRAALKRLLQEAQSLGAAAADPRHLLLALLEGEGSATQFGLHALGLSPVKIHQAIMLTFRKPTASSTSTLTLDRAHIQPLLAHILNEAGALASRDPGHRITEPMLLSGMLAIDSTARRTLEQQKVDLDEFRRVAASFQSDETDQEQAEAAAMCDVATIEKRLLERLVGQDDAVVRILPHLQRMRFGFSNPNRPVGVFLFCGQSGSGKTEMAKELARAVYGSEENLLFLEMGQFNSPESMNIFVGAAPGYVGYGEGKLTNGLRDKPRAVVLFDEVEKAHPRVLDALLRFLDEGKIADPAGPIRDGTQCLVILTSNIGAEALSRLGSQLGSTPAARATIRKRLREEFQNHKFRIEFLNRVDELILFRTLGADDYTEIARRILRRDLARLLERHGIKVLPDESVPGCIGTYCASIGEGARAAQRLVQSVVITPVIDHVVRHAPARPVTLRVRAVQSAEGPDAEPEGIVEG